MKNKTHTWAPLFMNKENTKSTLTVEGDYILLMATGEHNITFAKEIFASILQACLQEKKHKVIIDISKLVGTVSSVEKFDYLDHVSKLIKGYIFSGGKPPKIAHLLDPEYLKEGKGFTDVLAKQLNINMKGFAIKEVAQIWLDT